MASVIIRNKNEGEYIGFALQSVIDHIPGAEILVIDNKSTDDSIEIVNLFKNIANIRVITIDNYSPGLSIMLGAKEATNDTLLILSAHSQITHLNLNEVKDNLKDYVAVFGKQTPIYRGKKITPRYIWSHFKDEFVTNMYSDIETRYFLHNAFCFYDKQFLLNHPFDLSLPGKEDRYWAIDMANQGYKYLYNPQQKVNHYYTKNGATWKGIG
jgi:glycosyltransferase involved in cell wall biosynthesis